MANAAASTRPRRKHKPGKVSVPEMRASPPVQENRASGEQIPPVSVDDLVMRSVNLRRSQDEALRELAYRRRVSKNDLIRAALASKLAEWENASEEAFQQDLVRGLIGIQD